MAGLLKGGRWPGRKPNLIAATVAGVLELTLRGKPAHATHWSTQSMAAVAGISDTSVQLIWKAHGLQPHRVETFKLSRGPHLDRGVFKSVKELEDAIRAYLDRRNRDPNRSS